ncbi:MAG: protoporphyrinogen oxidase [Acidobacteriota bacterium]
MKVDPANGPEDRGAGASRRVVVVGGGIAGLSCAHRLAGRIDAAGRPIEITLLEAGERTGGVIQTERLDGFLIERGPDCFITEKPSALDLCRRVGLQDQVIGTNPDCRRSFVLRRGRLLRVPEGYQLMAPGRLLPFAASSILSPLGKLRAACDLILPRGPDRADESLASFVRRRFGEQVLERLAQPLVAGIYNADPETLSLRATMPRFLEMERSRRSLILALRLADRRRGAGGGVSGARYSLFATLRDGLQTLTDRLAGRLPAGSIRLGARALELARSGRGWAVATASGETLAADAVVLAVPANASAPLLRTVDPELSSALASIPYGTSATVNLGYREADVPTPMRGFGFVVPRSEGLSLIACSFSSLKFPGRARDGTTLLRVFLGGPWTERSDPERLERAARDDLRRALGITAEPIVARTAVWYRAMAQYPVGHLDRVARIDARLDGLPGLALAGNGLRGVGIPDCIRSGEEAAERIVAGTG